MAGFIDVPQLNFLGVFPYTRQAAASYSRPRAIAAKGCLGYKSETVHINRQAPETPVRRPPGGTPANRRALDLGPIPGAYFSGIF